MTARSAPVARRLPLSAIEAEDVCCERGGRLVLDGVSLRLSAGEAMVLTGPNGSGKSTLLRILAGLLRPQSGRVRLVGLPDEDAAAAAIHYIGHQDAVKPQLTVAENLGFWAAWYGAGKASVAAAAAATALDPLLDLSAAVLSAGQRRRLCLARLFLVRRPLWLLDEPTVALDRASRRALADAVHAQTAQGGIVLLTTHEDLPLPDARRCSIGDLARPGR